MSGYIKTGEASAMLNITDVTLRKYHKKGILKADYVSKHNTYYYKRETIEKFIEERMRR